MMERRAFLALATGGLLAAPLAAEAQKAARVPRIGYRWPGDASTGLLGLAAFRQGLRDNGYVDGENVVIELRSADGDMETLPELAAELVLLNPEVIVAFTAAGAVAAKHASDRIPIVFTAVYDPVALGLVASLARPGGTATGLTNIYTELTAKRFSLLKEAVSGVRTVGVLKPLANSDAANAETRAILKEYYNAARSLGVQLHVEDVKGPETFDHALATMKKEGVGAVMLIPNPLLFTYRARLIELSTKTRLPLMGWSREFSDAGAVLAYGANNAQMIRQAARYVARILHGAKPADLPIEQPTKFELVVNLKTAKALGLTLPPSLLQRADQVFE